MDNLPSTKFSWIVIKALSTKSWNSLLSVGNSFIAPYLTAKLRNVIIKLIQKLPPCTEENVIWTIREEYKSELNTLKRPYGDLNRTGKILMVIRSTGAHNDVHLISIVGKHRPPNNWVSRTATYQWLHKLYEFCVFCEENPSTPSAYKQKKVMDRQTSRIQYPSRH